MKKLKPFLIALPVMILVFILGYFLHERIMTELIYSKIRFKLISTSITEFHSRALWFGLIMALIPLMVAITYITRKLRTPLQWIAACLIPLLSAFVSLYAYMAYFQNTVVDALAKNSSGAEIVSFQVPFSRFNPEMAMGFGVFIGFIMVLTFVRKRKRGMSSIPVPPKS